jgi:hypothetical protein
MKTFACPSIRVTGAMVIVSPIFIIPPKRF